MYGMGQVHFTRDTFLKHLEYLREMREELQLCSTGSVDCMKEQFYSRLMEKLKPLGGTGLLQMGDTG